VIDFAKRLKQTREAKGMTPYRLAQLTGLSKQGVLNLEQSGADPKLSTIIKLADALDVPATDLLASAKANSTEPGTKKFEFQGRPHNYDFESILDELNNSPRTGKRLVIPSGAWCRSPGKERSSALW
jgi:transcriptional regulator with XRE-family HTH domain